VRLQTQDGTREIWEKDIERAVARSLTQPQIGDNVVLQRTGRDAKAFEAARDAALDKAGQRLYAHLLPAQRPTFHEIRGLGARLCRARGISEPENQALMTQASKRTTQIYLERGKEALTNDDYISVSAPLSARELLGHSVSS
jgi:hypothetical protein